MADVTIDIELVTAAFNKALREASKNVESFQGSVDQNQKQISGSFKKIDKSTKDTSKGFTILKGSVASFLGNLAANAVTSFARSLVSFSGSLVDNTIKLEQLSTQFTVLTGSASVAEKTLKDLQQFAATTPFQLENIGNAAAQLIGFGVEAEDIIPRLTRIGDVAASVNKPIGELALVFGQVQAAGKLTGERLLQLEERAVPIGAALAKTLDVPRESIRKLVSEGRVDFETFAKAFDSISDAGGQAFGGMIRQSKTLGGLLSTLKDNFALISTDIGQQFLPFFKEAVASMIEFIQANRELINAIAADAISRFTQVLQFLSSTFISVDEGITAFSVGLNSLQAVFNDVEAAVVSLASRILGFGEGFLTKFFDVDPASIEKLQKDLKIIQTEAELTSQVLEQDSQRTAESFNKRKQAVEDFTNVFVNANKAQQNADKETTDAIVTSGEKQAIAAAEAERAKQNAIKEVRDTFAEEEAILKIDAEIALEEANEGNLEKIRELELQKIEIVRDAELQKAALITGEVEKAKAIETANQKARISTLKVNNQAELALEKDKLFKIQDFNKLTNKQRLANLKDTLGTISTLQSSSSKELFAIGKASAIATATIDGFAAVQKALVAPFPVNIIQAALVSAATGANIAKIASTSAPSAGSFQDGGIVPGTSFTGDNLSANVNSGELILNKSQQQRLFNIADGTEQAATGALTPDVVRGIVESTVANMQITLVADDTEIARSTSRGVSNGVVIGVSA